MKYIQYECLPQASTTRCSLTVEAVQLYSTFSSWYGSCNCTLRCLANQSHRCIDDASIGRGSVLLAEARITDLSSPEHLAPKGKARPGPPLAPPSTVGKMGSKRDAKAKRKQHANRSYSSWLQCSSEYSCPSRAPSSWSCIWHTSASLLTLLSLCMAAA